ncbi:uncharacterized protein LOC119732253 [Patiria miniata]|uniref:Uncharacterized protein n=1 Tax=Patiria miniata TaxID=46514 RepID=A0A914AE43_PATMI|nr:uncharacterized protein LOC119732253 [Patiria miniata]
MLSIGAIARRVQSTLGREMYTSLSSARSLNFNAEQTRSKRRSQQHFRGWFPGESSWTFRRSLPAVRWLATARCLRKKDTAGKDEDDRTHKLLLPGEVPAAGHERIAGTQGKKTMIVSPPTVQVFADPSMSKTVRDVSVDIEKIKGQLKFMREEFSDSSFEVLKLVQGRSSIIAALKETRKFCRDNQSAIVSLKTEQRKFDELIAYISKMIARHENQMNDPRKRQDKDAVAEKIDGISQRIDQANKSIQNLTITVHDKLQSDVKKALADVKQLRNDVTRIELDVKYRGREISELKGKSPVNLMNAKQVQQKPPK